MKGGTMKSSFPVFSTNSTIFKTRLINPSKVSIKPPPQEFDFKAEIVHNSISKIEILHPELLDLAQNGTLVLIEKPQFGPVPAWRTDFIEPDAIWLLGTNHISLQSAADADRVIRAVMPDNVVVELCRSRAGMMYTSNEHDNTQQLRSNMFSLSGDSFFGAVGRSMNLGGQTALALRLLLALLSSKMSSDTNRSFGDEFRAARKASEEIGAQLVLGDRPIEITLERAWNSLKLSEKFNLLSSVIQGITSSTEASAENIKASSKDDSTFQLYTQLSFSYPSLLQPLIHERDTYLSWSLKRSKAVNKSKRVVGIIGKGHMNGVIYALISDLGDLRFRDLAGKNSSGNGWVDNLVKSLVRDTIISILIWGLYETIKSTL